MRIKDIPEMNRPRERLIRNGPNHLTDSELLALIIQTGTRHDNAVDVANRILSHGIHGVGKMALADLIKISGIGKAKAVRIKAAIEFARRAGISKKRQLQISSAEDAFYFLSDMASLDKENFVILILDTKNKVIRRETVSIGILNASLIHPREIFRPAIRNNAGSIILSHNHPSGDPAPSEEDRRITKKLVESGKIIGIPVIDHVIIGANGFYSFAGSGDIIFSQTEPV